MYWEGRRGVKREEGGREIREVLVVEEVRGLWWRAIRVGWEGWDQVGLRGESCSCCS